MLSSTPGTKLNRYVLDYVVFDLETTGISSTSDAVIEISAVKVRNGQVVDEFSTLVNPCRPIPYGVSSVNGIYDDMVKDSPVFKDVLKDGKLTSARPVLLRTAGQTDFQNYLP